MKINFFRKNGHAAITQTLNDKPSIAPPPVGERLFEIADSVRLAFYADIWEWAKQRTISSGALEVNDDALQSLIEHALAMARAAFRREYDPKQFIADRIREQEFNKILKERGEAEQAVLRARANVEALERKRAEIKTCGTPPQAPAFFWKIGGTATIGVAAAATLHDSLFLFSDDVTSWVVSAASGLGLGWFFTNLILSYPTTEHPEQNRWENWAGVGAGVLCGVGFFVMRQDQTDSFGGIPFTIGLTLLEFAAVFGLHAMATRYSQKLRTWLEQERPYVQMTEQVEVAKAHLEARRQELQRLEKAFEQGLAYQDERQLRSQQRKEIEDLAVTAVKDGAQAGADSNLGRIRGLQEENQ